MIGLWKGRGGPLRRAAGEVVPLLAAAVAGWVAEPLLGRVPGVVLGVVTWLVLSGVLAGLRRIDLLRRAYRLALLAFVVASCVAGVRASALRAAGPVSEARVVAWSGPQAFRAGVGEAAFALPRRTTLAGWGHGPRRLRLPAFAGVGRVGRLSLDLLGAPRERGGPRAPLFRRPREPGDVLGARALLLRPEGAGASLALVRLDLPAMESAIVPAVLSRTGDLGLTPATLLIAATHTHSGPGGYHRAPLAWVAGTDLFDRDVFEAVVEAAVSALRAAARDARPARLAVVEADDRGDGLHPPLGRLRGRSGLRDRRVPALRVEELGGGAVIGVVLNLSVHPTALRPDHPSFGRDLPGLVEEAVSEALPGRPPVLVFNGALGDVSPSETGREKAAALARAFARRVAGDLGRGRATASLRLRAARVTRDLGTPHTFVSTGERTAFARQVLPSAVGRDTPSCLANLLALPANALVWSLGLSELRLGFTFEGSAGAVLNLERAVTDPTHACGALVLEDDRGEERAAVLWQGGEATQALAWRWRQAAERGGAPAPFLFGLTNGALAYLTTEQEYDEGGYEARATLYGRDAGARVGEALRAALDAARGAGAER